MGAEVQEHDRALLGDERAAACASDPRRAPGSREALEFNRREALEAAAESFQETSVAL
jgi:hypothetical protein